MSLPTPDRAGTGARRAPRAPGRAAKPCWLAAAGLLLLLNIVPAVFAQPETPSAQLWIGPEVPDALARAVIEAVSAQLSGVGVSLEVARGERDSAPDAGVPDVPPLTLLILRAVSLEEAEMVVVDLRHGRRMRRPLAADPPSAGAISEVAGLIARDAVLAASAPSEEPPPRPAPPEGPVDDHDSSDPPEANKRSAPANSDLPAPTAEGPETAPSAPERHERDFPFWLGLAYAADLPAPDLAPGHGPQVQGQMNLGPRVFLRAALGFRFAATARADAVSIVLRRVPANLLVGLQLPLGKTALRISGSVGLGAEMWWRQTNESPGFVSRGSALRTRYAAVLSAQLALSLRPSLRAFAGLELWSFLNNFRYTVAPSGDAVLRPAWFLPRLMLGLSWAP